MYRKIQDNLNIWRSSARRKPLLLKGSRQVGKTFILKNWGKSAFAQTHYVNFEKQIELRKIFSTDLDTKRLVREIAFSLNAHIDPQKDLLILDEIQECPRALTALKYFCEELPELAVCSAGSLLGVALSQDSFPVGKVNFLFLHPMDFSEFLLAVDDRNSMEWIGKPSITHQIPTAVHEHLWSLLKIYYITGGMPEAVGVYLNEKHNLTKAFSDVRTIQRNILMGYEQDFAKHSGKANAVHIQSLYRNIPMQLSEGHDDSTRRFRFTNVIAGKKGFPAMERPLHWLINAGLVLQVKIANQIKLPLEHFCSPNQFKLFTHDIGLLGAMLDLSTEALLLQDYGTAKGFYAENFVAQEFRAASETQEIPLYSWNEGTAQIEFVRSYGEGVIPVEVKAGHRTKAKSLAQFIRRYQPDLSIKISANPPQLREKLWGLPLYLSQWAMKVNP